MKYTSKQISNSHGQPTVYTLTVGIEELKLLRAIVISAQKYTPDTTENHIVCSRLRNFVKTLNQVK